MKSFSDKIKYVKKSEKFDKSDKSDRLVQPGKYDPPPKVTFKDVSFLRIMSLFKPYRNPLVVIIVLALAASIIGLGPPLVMKHIIDEAIPNANRQLLYEMVALMVLLPLSSGLLRVLQNYLNTKVGQAIIRDLRQKLFKNLQLQSMAFFTNRRSGEVIQRITGDVQMVQSVVTSMVVSALTQIAIVVTAVAILLSMDWKLTLIALFILPIFISPIGKVTMLRKKLRLEAQQVRSEMTSHLNETFGVSGALLTRIFTREERQQERFTELNEKSMDLELKSSLVGRWYSMFMGILSPLGAALIYVYGGLHVMTGSMTIGSIIAFAAYLGRLYSPISSLLNLHIEVSTALVVFQRIFEYQDMEPEVHDVPDAKELPRIKGRIEFQKVSFSYKPGEVALKNISFEARPGQLIALVGQSGAGKSTLIGMLARLYDPSDGRVLIDGYDIKEVTLGSLRSQMAFVTQESYMLHASIIENLQFAKEDATQAEIEEACRRAYIHDRIMSFPDGYETITGERGNRLSGGEKQRLSIARAILKDPQILVLDEATSHLDSQSEVYVQQALEELMRDRTTVVIAHRLSTVMSADKILVMRHGRVIEQGTHEELLRRGGKYAELYHTQFDLANSG